MSGELMLQVSEDIKEAMKAKQAEKLNALRYLKSMLIENKTSATPKAELDVVVALSKKLKDSCETFPIGDINRIKLEQEVAFISAYLPAALNEQDVLSMIKEIKLKAQQNGPVHLGVIMKELTPLIKGRFDGKRASELVKEALS
jgi:uncharacterized protein YqeY